MYLSNSLHVIVFFLALSKAHADCITDPTKEDCKYFEMDEKQVLSNIARLCGEMKMPECDILNLCENNKAWGIFCKPFGLYKEICTDMTMTGCENYTSMCNKSTVVEECGIPTLPLPSQYTIQSKISYMCQKMPHMSFCKECPQPYTCDNAIIVYSQLCQAMPGMKDCDSWQLYCSVVPDWTICAGEPGNLIPEMRMYFHIGFVDYILFSSWVPYNSLTYAFSVIAVFLMAFFHEGFKVIKINMETEWRLQEIISRSGKESQHLNTSAPSTYKTTDIQHTPKIHFAPFDCKRDSLRALYRLIDVTAHFMIMLIAMTFNVGLFVAILVGYGSGHLVFSRLSQPILPNLDLMLESEKFDCH